LPEIYHRTEFS